LRVGVLIGYARSAPKEDTPGVTWRIRNTLARRTERRARVLRFATVGAVIFLAGGVVGAVVHPLLRTRPSSSVVPAVTPTAPEPRVQHRAPHAHPTPEKTAPPEQEPAQVEIPSAVEAPVVPALPTSARNKPKSAPLRLAARPAAPEPAPPQPVPPPEPAAAVAPASTAAEQALLSEALGKLRATHEPAAALSLLDDYRARFPKGVLAAEAARLRREALLILGRKSVVLLELDWTASVDATTGDERILRGELRAKAGRWQEAFDDFDAVVRAHETLGEVSDPRLRNRFERALWGRASARSHLGEDDTVCADLGEYLRRFPRGRFAGPAKQLLDKECEP
jgi:hypothetical protein